MNEFKFIKKGLMDLNVKTGSFFSSLTLYCRHGVMSFIPDAGGGQAEGKKKETRNWIETDSKLTVGEADWTMIC